MPLFLDVYIDPTRYHKGFYDPTCTLVVRVETVEGLTNTHRVVGYAVLNIFTLASDVSKQPESSADKDVLLNEGDWQLLLHQRPPNRAEPMTVSCLKGHGRMSAATVLVRSFCSCVAVNRRAGTRAAGGGQPWCGGRAGGPV